MATKLTDHFSLEELDCKCGCTAPASIVASLKKTAAFMERVRAFLGGKSITVNSGYRCPVHNRNVGGEPNSFHMRGLACDFTVAGMTPAEVQKRLEEPGSPVAQQGKGSYARFTHVDRRGSRARWNG